MNIRIESKEIDDLGKKLDEGRISLEEYKKEYSKLEKKFFEKLKEENGRIEINY